MKFLLQIFGIIVLGHMFSIFLPWYFIALAAFVMGYGLKSKANFVAGFLGVAMLWVLKAWLMDSAGNSDLTERVASIFMLKNKALLFMVMGVVGGLVGGFGALTGALLKKNVETRKI
ncbi:hypothetical protein [Chryseolinea sp. H1M3-3]|uniref:hypothetical protein n=1 Tax=Chryseolinea sp. H1M3-3 TaxID=3034144 RepID=UPI0023EADD9D|nr:hypothetical protein [Chryseolinea sp. H1M3-3]